MNELFAVLGWADYAVMACLAITALVYQVPALRGQAKAAGLTPGSVVLLGSVIPLVVLLFFIDTLPASVPLVARAAWMLAFAGLAAWVCVGMVRSGPPGGRNVWRD